MMANPITITLIEQAMVKALTYENQVRDVYREACGLTKDPIGLKIFGVLAEEEQSHVDYLEAKLEALRSSGEVVAGELRTALPSPEVIRAGIAALRSELTPVADRETEQSLLLKAVSMEKETSDFYHAMVRELPPEGQAFFRPFLAIEDGHVVIVQAELDSVTGLGFWFDYQEFDLEAG